MVAEEIQSKVEEHAAIAREKYGEDQWWCTMLYGSQNYGLADENSDVDTKTLIIPLFSEVVLGKPQVSVDAKMPDGSMDCVKDFRGMFKAYLKGNINFVETLYTDYYTVNPKYMKYFRQLRNGRDIIADSQPLRLVKMVTGMVHQKFEAMEKPTHARQEVHNKYGYDPKQVYRLAWLRVFIHDFIRYGSFYHAMRSGAEQSGDYLYAIKTGGYSLDAARQIARESIRDIDDTCNFVSRKLPLETVQHEVAEGLLDSITIEIFKDIWKRLV